MIAKYSFLIKLLNVIIWDALVNRFIFWDNLWTTKIYKKKYRY